MATASASFLDMLHADAPAPDRVGGMALYGWLIGAWTMDAVIHADDGARHEAKGHISFGWVLEGRAIQDVWNLPGFFHGTTLRVYDPALDAWHILWSDPLKQYYTRQIGRAEGRDIVQHGKVLHSKTGDGVAIRWRFTEITRDCFRWLGEASPDDGVSWRLQADVRARRTVP